MVRKHSRIGHFRVPCASLSKQIFVQNLSSMKMNLICMEMNGSVNPFSRKNGFALHEDSSVLTLIIRGKGQLENGLKELPRKKQ